MNKKEIEELANHLSIEDDDVLLCCKDGIEKAFYLQKAINLFKKGYRKTSSLPKEIEFKVEKLKDFVKIQSSKGCYDIDEYMRGIANGLILALSVFTEEEPKYHEPLTREDESEEASRRG